MSSDANLRPTLLATTKVKRNTVNDLAARANWVLPGLEEGRLPTVARSPKGIALFYRQRGASFVVVNFGDQGAYYNSETAGNCHMPIFPATEVVDTAGAGDGFAVGIMTSLLKRLAVP